MKIMCPRCGQSQFVELTSIGDEEVHFRKNEMNFSERWYACSSCKIDFRMYITFKVEVSQQIVQTIEEWEE